jgi:hypothetical protein
MRVEEPSDVSKRGDHIMNASQGASRVPLISCRGDTRGRRVRVHTRRLHR